MSREFLEVTIDNYNLIYNKIKYYSEYEYDNGMATALSILQEDEVNRISSEKLEEDTSSPIVKIRRACVEDAVENVEYMVDSVIRYNKVSDKQWLRTIRPLLR